MTKRRILFLTIAHTLTMISAVIVIWLIVREVCQLLDVSRSVAWLSEAIIPGAPVGLLYARIISRGWRKR